MQEQKFDLNKTRNEIDRIDGQLKDLLMERLAISRQIAKYKALEKLPVYNQKREYEILKVIQTGVDKDSQPGLKSIWNSILRSSRAIQYHIVEEQNIYQNIVKAWEGAKRQITPCRYVGFVGSSDSLAANQIRHLGKDVVAVPSVSNTQAFEMLMDERVDYLMMPLSGNNCSTQQDLLTTIFMHKVHIVATYNTETPYKLYGNPGVTLSGVTTVVSTIDVLEKVDSFIKRMGWNSMEVMSLQSAVRKITNMPNTNFVVIATEVEAAASGLEALPTQLMNLPTRDLSFALIGRELHRVGTHYRARIRLVMGNKEEYLAYCTGIWADHGLTIYSLNNRHLENSPWNQELVFEIGLDERQKEAFWQACTMLRAETLHFRILGIYPEITE